ncbi:DUF3080 family protein [Salinibius halmophilus]|uniref:DUF3080 family protein n=1 Tax=Salinibius halmophilus TaxID=1853216 RepID=UPI000E6653A7|nr:DUF3080 family protein [Salinibius halmophilus]
MRAFFVLLSALTLIACQQTTSNITEDYEARVARVLSVDNPNMPAAEIISFPRQANLAIELSSIRLDVLDAWSLRECGLLPFIGERNSVLGQVMLPSLALDYEVRLLAQLNSCVDNPDIEQDLIRSIIAQKQAQLPARMWNATLASEEFRQFWRRNQGEVTVEQVLPTSDLAKVLMDWQKVIVDPSVLSLKQFEANNQTLYQMNVGMSWLRSTLQANATLANTNAMLEQAIAKPLCPRGTIPAARNAQNVMVKYFVGELQPHFAMLNRFGAVLVTDVQAVQSLLAVENSEFVAFMDLVTETHKDFHRLNRQHVALWQQLMNSCDLSLANIQ